GSAHPRNAPYQVFRCKGGYFGMAAGNNSLWKSVCEVVGRMDLYEDARFTSPPLRAENQDTLREILEEIFANRTSEEWLQAFRDAGVPCAPINNYSDVLKDPQVEYMEWVQDLNLPNGAATKTFASPIRFGGRTSPIANRPPALGEHNDEVLGRFRVEV